MDEEQQTDAGPIPRAADPVDLAGLAPATLAVLAGRGPHEPGAPLGPSMVLTSNYHFGGAVGYGRDGNPTWTAFETTLGALEGGLAVAFASGMAAVTAVLDEVPPGATVVTPLGAYRGSRKLLADYAAKGRIAWREVDVTDTSAALDAAAGAALLWIESPTNPLLGVADLPALIGGAKAGGTMVAVDNTFATPLGQKPLEFGADVVVHSVTKFLSGHADLIMGAVVTADPELRGRLAHRRATTGAIPGVFEAWLALRGLRTLALRVERSWASAGELAERLCGHPAIASVRYPGLAGDPGHERARTTMRGFGAIVSFEVAGGAEPAEQVCRSVRLIADATSLGGVESNMERRARWSMEEATPPGLIRLSVGCEDVEDLWRDLKGALDRVSPG
jgi:cystathionine gamma-synthase